MKLNAAQIRMIEYVRDHGNPLHGSIYVKQATWAKTKKLELFKFDVLENKWVLTPAGEAVLQDTRTKAP